MGLKERRRRHRERKGRQDVRRKVLQRPFDEIEEVTEAPRTADNPFGFSLTESHATSPRDYDADHKNTKFHKTGSGRSAETKRGVKNVPLSGFKATALEIRKPLPEDHPLKVELAQLKKVREQRKLYWLALAQRLGAEWNDPNSMDRQRLKEEEEMADRKLEVLAVQIFCAEQGALVDSTLSAHSSVVTRTGRFSHDESKSTQPFSLVRDDSPSHVVVSNRSNARPRDMQDHVQSRGYSRFNSNLEQFESSAKLTSSGLENPSRLLNDSIEHFRDAPIPKNSRTFTIAENIGASKRTAYPKECENKKAQEANNYWNVPHTHGTPNNPRVQLWKDHCIINEKDLRPEGSEYIGGGTNNLSFAEKYISTDPYAESNHVRYSPQNDGIIVPDEETASGRDRSHTDIVGLIEEYATPTLHRVGNRLHRSSPTHGQGSCEPRSTDDDVLKWQAEKTRGSLERRTSCSTETDGSVLLEILLNYLEKEQQVAADPAQTRTINLGDFTQSKIASIDGRSKVDSSARNEKQPISTSNLTDLSVSRSINRACSPSSIKELSLIHAESDSDSARSPGCSPLAPVRESVAKKSDDNDDLHEFHLSEGLLDITAISRRSQESPKIDVDEPAMDKGTRKFWDIYNGLCFDQGNEGDLPEGQILQEYSGRSKKKRVNLHPLDPKMSRS